MMIYVHFGPWNNMFAIGLQHNSVTLCIYLIYADISIIFLSVYLTNILTLTPPFGILPKRKFLRRSGEHPCLGNDGVWGEMRYGMQFVPKLQDIVHWLNVIMRKKIPLKVATVLS